MMRQMMSSSRCSGDCKPAAAASRPASLRHTPLRCLASKTTSSRSPAATTSSRSSTSSSTGAAAQGVPGRQQPAAEQEAPRKSIQDHARAMQQRVESVVHYLTPKQEGDAGDVLMIGISLAVFIYLAMQMYRLYFYLYLQLGVMDMMS